MGTGRPGEAEEVLDRRAGGGLGRSDQRIQVCGGQWEGENQVPTSATRRRTTRRYHGGRGG